MTQLKKFFLILPLAFGVVACEPQGNVLEALSEAEAVEVLQAELQAVAGGVTSEIENIATEIALAISSGQYCDTLILDSMVADHQGPRIQTEYSSDYSYDLTCNGFNLPQSATFTSNAEFHLTTKELESDNTSLFSGDATGVNSGPFQISVDTIEINGNYDKSGVQDLNVINTKNLTSTFSGDLTDFKVGVSSQQIEAGVLDFVFSGTSTQLGSFSHIGTITYHGNKTATLIIDGTSYPIDWN